MKKRGTMKGILTAVAMMAASALSAQVYKTSTGVIKFFSHTTMEDIDATNSQVAAAMDAASGAVEISLSVNAFQFKKALMQKHFQENYMETGKFPKSTFKGALVNKSAVNFAKDGTYPVSVKGKLTMHGVTKEVTIPGSVIVKGTKATLSGNFNVNLDDYKIVVPANNAASISKTIKITVDCGLVKK